MRNNKVISSQCISLKCIMNDGIIKRYEIRKMIDGPTKSAFITPFAIYNII